VTGHAQSRFDHDWETRVRSTADAIRSIPYIHTSPVATTYVLIDHLLLLVDGPAGIDLACGGDIVHSSLPARERALAGVPARARAEDCWAHGELTFSLATVDGGGAGGAIGAVFGCIRGADPERYRVLVDRLHEFAHLRLKEIREAGLPAERTSAPAELTIEDAEVAGALAPFEERYERIVGRHAAPGSVFLTPGDPTRDGDLAQGQMLTLLGALRFVPRLPFERTSRADLPPYSYAVRPLLTHAQREALLHSAPASESDPAGYRAVDAAFSSGHVFIAHPAPALLSPAERLIVMRCDEPTTLANVPIHVGGTAWIALVGCFARRRWESLLHFYQLTVPLLAADLRVAAQDAFLERLVAHLRAELADAGPLSTERIERINACWRKTSMVYPFPVPSLEPAGEEQREPESIVTLGDAKVTISVQDGAARPLPPQVDYEPLSAERIRAACREAVYDLELIRVSAKYESQKQQTRIHELATHEVVHDLEEVLKVLRLAEISGVPDVLRLQAALSVAHRLAWGLFGKPWLQRKLAKKEPFAWAPGYPTEEDLRFWFGHFGLLAAAVTHAKTEHLGERAAAVRMALTVRGTCRDNAQRPDSTREVTWSLELQGGRAALEPLRDLLRQEQDSGPRLVPPWPLPPKLRAGDLDRDGQVAVLQLGTFELLRNAVNYVVTTLDQGVVPEIAMEIVFDPERRAVTARIANNYDPNYDPLPKPRTLNTLNQLIPELTITFAVDKTARRCVAESALALSEPQPPGSAALS